MENINSKMMEKKPYVTPEVTVHGDIEVITLSTHAERKNDVQFSNTRRVRVALS